MKKGFTLAEILITLGIIGIVAAITLPILINQYQKQVVLNRLKKTYSALAQAIVQSESENEEMIYWGLSNMGHMSSWSEYKKLLEPYVKKYFIPYLNIGIDCGYECSAMKEIKVYTLSGIARNWYSPWSGGYVLFLNDGTILNFWADNSAGNMQTLGIDIDVNGLQKPNTYGKDIFVFRLNSKTKKFNLDGATLNEEQITSASDRSGCNTGAGSYAGFYCGGWIQKNSWQFPKNYPW